MLGNATKEGVDNCGQLLISNEKLAESKNGNGEASAVGIQILILAASLSIACCSIHNDTTVSKRRLMR